MKELVIGVFRARADAERAVERLHRDLGIDHDELSYVYRSSDGMVREVDPANVSSTTPAEGAKTGAAIGGSVGALAGIAAAAGVIPVVGPLFAAGPLATALGISGALGATAAGAVTGAAAGGLIGALVSMGVGEEQAQHYEDEVRAGSILVAAHATDVEDAARTLDESGAYEINVYSLTPA